MFLFSEYNYKKAVKKSFMPSYFLLVKLFKIFLLSFFLTNNAGANGSFYGGKWPDCLTQFYTHRWVSEAANSTLFAPTASVNYDTMVACVGYHGTVTLGTSTDNCNWIGDERYCARLAPENEYCNGFACDGSPSSEAGYNCGSSAYDGKSSDDSSCTPGETYTCPGDKNKGSAYTYLCDTSGKYNCSCPNCRDICAMRVCVYLDASEDNGFSEYNDPDSRYMPYFQNQGDTGKNISGQMQHNNNEVDQFIGCVDIPIGPYPPPLCDPVIGASPVTNVMEICDYSPDYEEITGTVDDNNYKQNSVSKYPCVLSTSNGNASDVAVYNIFEKPIVRLFFSNPLPVCSSGYSPPSNIQTGMDTCFQISTSWSPEQIWGDQKNLLQVCGTKAGDSQTDCIIFPSGRAYGPNGGSTSFGNDYTYFTTYYNEGNTSDIEPYVYYDPADYTNSNPPTLYLGGIYDTYYEDIYPGAGSGDPPVIDIIDYNGNTRYFCAFIDLGVDTCNGGAPTSGNGDGSQICVDEINETSGTSIIGCYDRPSMFPPVVSSCLTQDSCYYSSGTNISSQPRISYDVGRAYTNPVTSPQTGIIGIELPSDNMPVPFCVLDDNNPNGDGNSTDDPTPCTVYQSKGFSAYITDDTNYSIDYDPYAVDGTVTPYKPGEQYTGGMQYVDYVYCRGGTKICLTGYSNTLKNVVTKAVTITTNGMTTTSASNILTDRIIPPYNSSADSQIIDNSQLYNSDANNWYGSTTTVSTWIGYSSTVNGVTTNIVGSGCDDWDCTYDSNSLSPTNSVPATCTQTNSLGQVSTYNGTQCLIAFQTSSTTDGGTLQGYQYPGNYVGYGATDTKPSPWNACSYDSVAGMTECPLFNNANPPVQQYMVRPLNSMELGLCTDILQPYCEAITDTQWGDTSNGYATWPQTSVNGTATGTCINGAVPANGVSPTRTCSYLDTVDASGNPVYQTNGCPEFTQVWNTVNNPCVAAGIPGWWPGQFLAGNKNLLGAIINQFNVRYDYRYGVTGSAGPWFTPYYANADPLNYYTSSTTSVASYEPWNSGYPDSQSDSGGKATNGACRKDGAGNQSSYARKYTNGDQEMLYLTQQQWITFWNNYNMTWLLNPNSTSPVESSSVQLSGSNDGCYVYNLKAQSGCNGTNTYSTDNPSFLCANNTISANFSPNVIPGMKICKYEDKISFALVDLGPPDANGNPTASTDYNNINYIMQSNIMAYASKQSDYHGDSSFILTNNISGRKSLYDTRTNNGIVVKRSGFSYEQKTDGNLPKDFKPYETAEAISVQYQFSTSYQGKHKNSWGETRHTNCTNNNPSSGYTSVYNNPLSIFRNNLNITSNLTAVSYLNSNPNPSCDSYSNFVPNNTSLYVGQNCNDDTDQWLTCTIYAVINSYTKGNSANNQNMFLWTSPTSYNVSNNQ